MADTGLRIAEALALTTGDLVKEGGVVTHVQVRHGKGGKTARLPVTQRAAVRLGVWLEARPDLGLSNGAVFCTVSRGRRGGFGGERTLEPGRPLSARYVRQLLDRKAREAGIERHISPHTLRHTFATHLLRQTGNLELTRKALRHANVTTTAAIYSHLQPRDVEEAVLALRNGVSPLSAPSDPQVRALAAALASLTEDQRQALMAARGGK
jgi:integrase